VEQLGSSARIVEELYIGRYYKNLSRKSKVGKNRSKVKGALQENLLVFMTALVNALLWLSSRVIDNDSNYLPYF
jgi:hypothetical protein